MGNRTAKVDKESETKEGSAVDRTKNKIWVARIEEHFDILDVNKNGYVTIEEILKWADNLKELCKITPDEVQSFHDNLKEFYGAAGLVAEKQVTKSEFVEGVNRLAQAELERKESGEATLHEKFSNSFFDVVDVNNDGTVTLDELTTLMKACSMDEARAEEWFNKADKNENGKVERNELIRVDFEYYFNAPEDKDDSGADNEEKQ